MTFAPVNGQQINFEDTGGDGPVVVIGHGFLMDHTMFRHQVAVLRDQYRVVAPGRVSCGGVVRVPRADAASLTRPEAANAATLESLAGLPA